MNPLVSIIIPVFNREDFIFDTLESIRNQSYDNIECIIVDDGSTDDTIAIIRKFCDKDSRFSLEKRNRPPKGAPTCRNIGFELSKGTFIHWFDADDLMGISNIEAKVSVLSKDLESDFAICGVREFRNSMEDADDDYLYKLHSLYPLLDYLNDKYYFITSVPMFRRAFLESKRLFDEQLIRHQENELFIRFLLSARKIAVAKEAEVFKRTHLTSISSKYSNKPFAAVLANNFRFKLKVLDALKSGSHLTDPIIAYLLQDFLWFIYHSPRKSRYFKACYLIMQDLIKRSSNPSIRIKRVFWFYLRLCKVRTRELLIRNP